MSNSINYASVFNKVIDSHYFVSSRTGLLERNSLGIVWDGGREVKIPKLATDGLGNVSGCEVPNGDITYGYETQQLQWDRGRTFSFPRYAVNETNFTLTVPNVIRQFVNEQMNPEVDKLRLSTIATKAIEEGRVVYEGSSKSANPLKLLLKDIANIQDKIGEDKTLTVYCSQTMKSAIMESNEITKHLAVREMTAKGVNLKIDTVNDCALVGVPSSYMKTAFTLNDGTTSGQTAGGVVPATGAKNINWIIVADESVVAVGYPRVEKVITPDQNQDGDCWKVMFHLYHGIFVMENKTDGILVNCEGNA